MEIKCVSAVTRCNKKHIDNYKYDDKITYR